ncbi:MAG: hypothetical protein EOP48_14640, partial [Sphingobacteriales bacterium]
MNNYKSDLSDEMFDKIQKIEVGIRGRYMRVSAHTEALLVKNIILLNEENCVKTNTDIILNFRKLTFDEKIKELPKLLQELHPDLLQPYSDLLLNLDEFRKIRNNMAHSYFTWNPDNLTYVTIWELQKKEVQLRDGSKRKVQHFEPVDYKFDDLSKKFKDLVGVIMDDLNDLTYKLMVRL